MKNNVVAKVKTAFLKGSDLVTEALKEYNFQSENYNYPRYTFGDPNYTDNYFEIWSTGMDWNTVYFVLRDTYPNSHSAKPILFFSSGDSHKIGEGNFIQILQAICNVEEGKKHWALSDSLRPFIKPIKSEHFVMKKGNLNFYLVEYSHASQKPVKFYIEEKSYNVLCHVIGTCKCGENLYNSDVKSISSKTDSDIIISHAKCKCGEVKDIGTENVKPSQ